MVVQNHREAFQFLYVIAFATWNLSQNVHSEMGESARKIGETCLNEQSSRSHTIFRVSVEIRSKTQSDKIIYSTLNLVDLAGSEGVSRAKTEGIRKR